MRFFLRLDSELAGALDASGCYHNPTAVNGMLDEYGILDFEERRSARWLLRCIGDGRARGMQSVDDPESAALDV